MEKLSSEERVQALESKLGVVFVDRTAALAALTHKSFTHEHKHLKMSDNERLEFLGDAVVDLAVGHHLMQQFPAATEGELSKLRALIVNEEGLSKVARTLGIGTWLMLGRGEELTGGRDKSSVLADALEAVIGAYFVGSGFAAASELIKRLFHEALNTVALGGNGQDYKTMLQEETQLRLKAAPKYRVVQETGPDHEKVFEVEVLIGATGYARALGRSKKEAEQAAARQALGRIHQDFSAAPSDLEVGNGETKP